MQRWFHWKGGKSRRGKIKKDIERENRGDRSANKKKKRLFLHPNWDERKEGMQRWFHCLEGQVKWNVIGRRKYSVLFIPLKLWSLIHSPKIARNQRECS